ncbi:hypothetical protein [Acidipropionibacterium jensenii]|uniref:hypothetical protein n=1 Tax=Acidipropionibacterium jensenii TaxID=1749 RepID=UPI00214B1BA6|nr:hypothetical protein [Acidipropionibacterium jensenii]
MTETTVDQSRHELLPPDHMSESNGVDEEISAIIGQLPPLAPIEHAVARALLSPRNDPSQMAASPTDMVELYSMFTMPVASGRLENWPATGLDQVLRVLREYFTRTTGLPGYFEAEVSYIDEEDVTSPLENCAIASITLLTSMNLSAGQWLSDLFRQDALRQVLLARYCAHPSGSALRTPVISSLIPAVTLATALVAEHARLIDTARRLVAQPDFADLLNRSADEVIDALGGDTVPTDIINLLSNTVLARLTDPGISLNDVARTQYGVPGLSELLTERGLV